GHRYTASPQCLRQLIKSVSVSEDAVEGLMPWGRRSCPRIHTCSIRPMLERSRLEEALDLLRRSYQLLLWLGEAVPRGFVSFDTAHAYASSADSARAWIEEHYQNLPTIGKPAELTEPSVSRFANVFASYLETSFDLIEKPGTRLDSR